MGTGEKIKFKSFGLLRQDEIKKGVSTDSCHLCSHGVLIIPASHKQGEIVSRIIKVSRKKRDYFPLSI